MNRRDEDKANGDHHFETEEELDEDGNWFCPFCNNTGYITDEVNGMTYVCTCTIFYAEEE